MADELKAGDRVVLAAPPTYTGKWGPAFVGPAEGIGGKGLLVRIERPGVANVQWDNPAQADGTPFTHGALVDLACLQRVGLDLPSSLRRKEVESWLDSP